MSKQKILMQLDPDSQPSSFDSIVALDSGVDQLLSYDNVTVSQVEGLVHGSIFTRGPKDLKHTAMFFGGSNVKATEELVKVASKCFFGPMRVSWMSDPNGSNTTAAAAVLSAEQHGATGGRKITILAGTGPVGQRIAQIIINQSSQPAEVPTRIRLCSRKLSHATAVCDELNSENDNISIEPFEATTPADGLAAIKDANVVFAAGAASVELASADWMRLESAPEVLIDLNAVPPAGIAGVDVMDNGQLRGSTVCYGAIGVGGLKMKIHKRCISSLFESNDLTLGVNEIYEIGKGLIL